MITALDVHAARDRIKPFIHRTPVIHSRSLCEITGADVFVKAENLQKTGAFKVRGAFNKMIGLPSANVIAASMGNHAQAVAFAASETGARARIIMPVTVSIVKEQASRGYGAEVALHGENLRQAMDYALSQRGSVFIHPFDDDLVIAGQGTIGLEICEELKGVDAILVPVGGGGLIAGIAVAVHRVSPGTEVIGVLTESAPSALRSFLRHRITAAPPSPTLADGIAVEKVGTRPFRIMRDLVTDIIAVKEDAIALAVLLYMERMKLVVEGAGAVPLAALLSNRERFKGKRVVLLASGGNIDFTVIDRIVRKGLVTNGRIAVVKVVVDDTPGNLHHITGIISDHRANILDVSHDRLTEALPVGKTRVVFTVEVRSRSSLHELLARIRSGGFTVVDDTPG
jgi:threonine dehydratase